MEIKMKTNIRLVFIVILTGLLLSNVFAQNKINSKLEEQERKSKQIKIEKQTSTKKIWNAYCPVMGEEVDPEVQTVEYKGKVIGFCCKSCIKKFQKDPEKYLKNLSPDGQVFIKK